MYKNILIPIDNSDFSNFGIDIGIDMARRFDAKLTGLHVYAARLHDLRFRQMEGGLPERYREEKVLEEQREIHDSLITKGLKIITDSYLDVFEKKSSGAGIDFERKSLEGKNFQVLVDDIRGSGYDLVIMGLLGLGAVKESLIGSVCERVARRARTDLLIVKNTSSYLNNGKIMVAIDGSPFSYGGLKIAIDMAKAFGLKVEAISAFDPYFHYVAFNSIAGVLSEEAGKIFRFKEQEKLHEEIIDSGLAKIYQSHLEIAKKISKDNGIDIETKLLDGKVFEQILRYVQQERPVLLVLGRVGIHSDDGMDIGSNTENLLRLAPCHTLITSRQFMPPIERIAAETIAWTKEAEERMMKVPSIARGMAKMAILRFARERGHTVITSTVVDQAVENLLPASAREAMGIIVKEASRRQSESDEAQLSWTKEAIERLNRVPAGFMRENTRLRIEKYARIRGQNRITEEIASAAIGEAKEMMQNMGKMMEVSPGMAEGKEE